MSKKSQTILERCFVPKDAVIMKQGEPADCAYLVQSGSVEVYTEHEKQNVVLTTLSVGEIFGEMGLINEGPRTASVRALEDCNLIVITHQALQYKLMRSDPTIKAIMDMLMKRIVSSNNVVTKTQNEIADFSGAARIIYENVLSSLPTEQQKSFQKKVLPKLEALLGEVKSFEESQS